MTPAWVQDQTAYLRSREYLAQARTLAACHRMLGSIRGIALFFGWYGPGRWIFRLSNEIFSAACEAYDQAGEWIARA